MARRGTPEVNASSMADIAFLLLVFFLVTTTMDVDSGLSRKLPPPIEDNEEKKDIDIKERNVYVVLLNMNNALLVEGREMKIENLKEGAKEFIENPLNNENLPEKKNKDIDFFGNYPVSKGVISLQNDRGTSYKLYLQVQNELIAAYNELRNEKAMQKWGKKFDDLKKIQKKAIKKIYPQRISEAEPKNIGEN
ncbi:MAG: biopolymer transporter ExbD [Bacteroidetes bacterium 4572_128]|nr:MAG: biopolymer transporter ExbD [Bacteroidetes bacterium 4572_128]